VKKIFGILIISTCFFVGQAQAVDTIISVCNHNTDRAIFSTYLIQAGAGAGWQSHGWFKTEIGQCNDINVGVYTGTVYLYAEDQYQETNWGEGDVSYCINRSEAFVINNADLADCSDPKLKKVKSNPLAVQPGRTTWDVQPNFSQLNFCNQSTYAIYASFARPSGTYTSEGWYLVDAGKCRAVTVGKYSGAVQYYGEFNLGQYYWDGASTPFCVNRTKAFQMANADQASTCNDPALKMVKSRTVDVQPGITTVNFEALNLDTILRLCNNTPDKTLNASRAISSTNGQWQSSGWNEIAPGKCTDINLGKYSGQTYLYAEWNLGQYYWGSGPFTYCVNRTQNFTLEDSSNSAMCSSDINKKMVPAFSFPVGPGTNIFTFNP
jgi:uncharacterized membrane protein